MDKLLKQVKKAKIYEDIVLQIHELIKSKKIRTGDRLPSERDLTTIFRVSRASVREAIRVLESQGILETRVGAGTYVTANSVETLVEPLATAIAGGRESLMEIFEVRRLIEPRIALLAAEKATDKEIEQLRDLLLRQKDHMDSRQNFTEVDYLFHNCLADMAKSEVLSIIYATLVELISRTREEFLQDGDRPRRSYLGHRDIVYAIQHRDPLLAERAMSNHIMTIELEALKNH